MHVYERFQNNYVRILGRNTNARCTLTQPVITLDSAKFWATLGSKPSSKRPGFTNTSHVMPFNAHIHTRYQLGLCEPLWFLARQMIMATFLTLMIPQLAASVPTGPLTTGCLSNILSDQ